MERLYIDGFSQIHFIAGVIRIDTFTYEAKPEGEPVQENTHQLVMTPQAFITAMGAMQQLADKLIEAGVLQKADPAVK